MILLPRDILNDIETAAVTAYPAECCGLLVGHGDIDDTVRLERAVASPNLKAAEHTDRFEVDPQVRFELMRALDGSGARIVGHYHSHPDHPPSPSATDLASAWEPEMIWLITAVADGKAGKTTVHVLADDHQSFRALTLTVEDRL